MTWSTDIRHYMSNPYFLRDSGIFMDIVQTVNTSGRWLERNLKSRPCLENYIDSCLPLLHESCYSMRTKIIWLMTGRTDFPECATCGKKFGYGQNIRLPRLYSATCSEECAIKMRKSSNLKTCLEKYGVDNVFQLNDVKRKIQDIKADKYGNVAYNNSEKRKHTCLEKYGETSYMRTAAGKNCLCQAMLKKYGVAYPLQSEQCLKKLQDTCIKKYGKPNCSSVETVSKRINTCLEKYGVRTPMQSPEIRQYAQKKYRYDGRSFDSSPELALYVWLTDNGFDFEYQPKISFKYSVNGVERQYMPDFRIADQYVELKGDQFLNIDGTWKNPYDRQQDNVYEAKRLCCLQNNVLIWTSETYNMFVEYCQQKFNDKKWHLKFKG